MDTSDIRKGLKLMLDGQPCVVTDFQFVKPGKAQSYTTTKLRNLVTKAVLERTWKSGEKLEPADVEERQLQYIYPEGSNFVFMDASSGEQITVAGEQVGADSKWLSDGMTVDVTIFNGQPLGIVIPANVVLQITSLEKTDDSQPLNQATVSTGAVVAVPKLLNEGDWIKINTPTGTYLEQVNRR